MASYAGSEPTGSVEVKSKFDAEFRRFSLDRTKYRTFESFKELLEELHLLKSKERAIKFHISYTDPKDNDLLPINNTNNYLRALQMAKPTLRLIIQRQGELEETYYAGRRVAGTVGVGGSSLLTSMLGGTASGHRPMISISQPSEFRQVAAIIDPDQVPETCRRVRLLKHGSDKPLGFYIRDGTSVRVTPTGIEKVPGIFISRLLAGGLAESTGLLAVNDEVLEVNGIEVVGKSLDQVTDMMVANSSNLIVTVKPANQRTMMPPPRRGSFSRNSNMSHGSLLSRGSSTFSNANSDGLVNDHDDEDEVRDLTNSNHISATSEYSSLVKNHSNNNRGSLSGGPSQKKQVLHL